MCNHNRSNFWVLFYEHVDWPLTLHQFYLEIFAFVTFNALNKKVLPILLRGFNDSYRNKKYTYRIFKDRVIERYLKLTADLIFDCTDYINVYVDKHMFEHICLLQTKCWLYLSKFRISGCWVLKKLIFFAATYKTSSYKN